jgi:hypothetical protein
MNIICVPLQVFEFVINNDSLLMVEIIILLRSGVVVNNLMRICLNPVIYKVDEAFCRGLG